MNCDVAVIGGGLAGLTCAVRAAMAGRKAIVLERSGDDLYLCNSRMATGVFHVAFNSLAVDAATLEQRAREMLGASARQDLLTAVCKGARPAIDWLREVAGARFIAEGDDPAYEFVLAPSAVGKFGREWQGRGADLLLRSLEQVLLRHGGVVRRGRAVRRLTMRHERCTGVAGESFEVTANAVVMADGGFQANLERLGELISPAPERLVQRNARTGIGDGLRMAQEAGAAFANRGGFYGHLQSRSALKDDRLWPYPWADELARACLVVGSDGRRVADEGWGGIYLANRIAALPDPASTWVICDQPGWEGPGAARETSLNPHLERMGGSVLRAPSLEGLARQSRIDGASLASTVAEYNAAITAGTADQLTPPRTVTRYKAWPVQRPPFYAIPIVPGITYTLGGIAIDGDSRALREDATPIPGLYAAGSTTGGLEGGERIGYVGGLVKATVTGLRAAEHLCR
jgi:fumarate reductase flavoprotein subunit